MKKVRDFSVMNIQVQITEQERELHIRQAYTAIKKLINRGEAENSKLQKE